jgi:hypothetical protein
MRTKDRLHSIYFGLAAFCTYTVVTILFFGFRSHMDRKVFMAGPDQLSFIWFLNWWPFALRYGYNPFITDFVWYPVGFNLTWAASVPSLALLLSPLTVGVGPIATWNVLQLFAPALNATAAFYLLRYYFSDFVSSLLGGYIFGFSSYVLGHLTGHLNLVFVPLVPIAVLLISSRLNRDINGRTFSLLFSLALVLQLGISTEILATACFFGGVTAVLLLLVYRREWPFASVASVVMEIAAAGVVALIISGSFVYYLLVGLPAVPDVINSPTWYSADISNYFIPTPVTFFGSGLFADIASRFTGNVAEQGAYLGLPLMFVSMMGLLSILDLNRRLFIVISTSLLFIIACSAGPILHINGKATSVMMPWSIFEHLPLIHHALPSRFTLYVSLLTAIISTYWVATAKNSVSRIVRILTMAFAILMILPDTSIYHWRDPSVPKYFRRMAKTGNQDSDIYLLFPYGYTGEGMLWQTMAGMTFRMAGGYVGFPPVAESKYMLQNIFYTGVVVKPREFLMSLAAYCFDHRIGKIILGPGSPDGLKSVLLGTDWGRSSEGGVTIINLPDRRMLIR